MKLFIPLIITLILLVTTLNPQGMQDEDVDKGQKESSENEEKKNQVDEKQPELDLLCKNEMNLTLDSQSKSSILKTQCGYEREKFFHTNNSSFVNSIVSNINNWSKNGWELERAEVTGFADGWQNRGIISRLSELNSASPICKSDIGETIDDKELAFLRGCIIVSKLREITGDKYKTLIDWLPPVDIPDGKEKGYEYRKVTVKLYFKKKKEVNDILWRR